MERIENKSYFGKIRKVYSFARMYMSANTNHPYHNWNHATDVGHAVLRIAREEGIGEEGRFILLTAALLHDAYFAVGGKYNEEACSQLARMTLPIYGYSASHADKVSSLILATKFPTSPKNNLEEILCDADLDNLGREDCILKGDLVRQEAGLPQGNNWCCTQANFLRKIRYYTQSERNARQEGIWKNIAELERLSRIS